MISRRNFNFVLAGAAVPLVTGARAAEPDKVGFIAYAMPTKWHPIAALGNWPLDHTAVSTTTGTQWGCFGRRQKDDPGAATVVATGMGDELWAIAIAGPDGHAGIDYAVTGVCDQCSNRILLPANIDVRYSPGNEIATLLCGHYGLGLPELITRIKDAAASVNKDHPGRISDAAVADVLARVGGGLDDEWLVLRGDIERIIKPVLGDRYDTLKTDIEDVYLSLYYKRVALAHAYEREMIDKANLVRKVNAAFVLSLDDLKDVIGAQSYAKIIPMPPQVAADYVFQQRN